MPLQSTYLGGTGSDTIYALAVHPISGEVLVAGYTSSTNLPGTPGGAQAAFGGGFNDGFVSRFNAALTTQLQSTYLGGTGNDYIFAMAVHPISGEVLVAGFTDSANLPGTTGGAQAASGGGSTDGFVSRLNAALTTRLQSTYLGGAGDDFITALAVHPNSGEVLVAGYTVSINLPGTTGGAQAASGGGYDGFVSRFNSALSTRLQSTYLGGTGTDQIYALAVHPISGEVLVAGDTTSTNLPGTPGGAQAAYGGGGNDGFVSRITPDLTLNDTTPDAFAFTSQTNVPRSSVRTSNPALISGLFGAAGIYADGQPGSSYCVSSTSSCTCDVSGGFVSTLGTVTSGNYVCARHTASAANNQPTQTIVHIGGGAAYFSASTGTAFATACNLDMDGDGLLTTTKEWLVFLRASLGFTGTATTIGTGISAAQWSAARPLINANCGTNFAP